jgi:hypothetical protein
LHGLRARLPASSEQKGKRTRYGGKQGLGYRRQFNSLQDTSFARLKLQYCRQDYQANL